MPFDALASLGVSRAYSIPKEMVTMSRRSSGFTLIELLVVIAIIAILAAILFPVFARARAKALQTACLNNVKQLTLGCLMYQSDNDGWMPPAWQAWPAPSSYPGWRDGTYPYVKNVQIFQCPSQPNAGLTADLVPGSTSTKFPISYAINSDCGSWSGNPPTGGSNKMGTYDNGPGSSGPQNASQIKVPAETILIMESALETESLSTDSGGGNLCTGANACQNIAAPHNGQSNYGFCDGHAKSLKPTATVTGTKCLWDINPVGYTLWGADTNKSTNACLLPEMAAAEACAANK
jgi:prepilin-type N-terminal cleavage/methylation domain-containing protein/prepilin-type processing-associated H-X9-DG protein